MKRNRTQYAKLYFQERLKRLETERDILIRERAAMIARRDELDQQIEVLESRKKKRSKKKAIGNQSAGN